MNLDVSVFVFPRTVVISNRYIGSYSNCSIAWDKIMSFAKKNQLFEKNIIKSHPNSTTVIGLGYDDPKKTKKCRYDACLAIQDNVKIVSCGVISKIFQTIVSKIFTCKNENKPTIMLEKGITKKTIAEHKSLQYTHKGSYDDFEKIYPALFELNYNFNYNFPCIEVYLNDPAKVQPSELLTEIYIPIY